MSKPWDNEPTPIIDGSDMYYFETAIEVGRNLERRMRAAERLLDITIRDIYPLVPEHDILVDDIKAHLDSARKEDNADYIGEDNPVCQSCTTPFDEHLGLVGMCYQLSEVTAELHAVYRKWEADKYLLRGALRIIRDAGLQVGSTELIDAARKEDGQ